MGEDEEHSRLFVWHLAVTKVEGAGTQLLAGMFGTGNAWNEITSRRRLQELSLHASSKITMDIYTQALWLAKLPAQSCVVSMIRP